MRKSAIIAILAAILVAGSSAPGFASDWDKAGKVLAVFEGLRVLTGGKADVIGTVTGINQPRQQARDRDCDRGGYARHDRGNHYGWSQHERCTAERVWVPHYMVKEEFVPGHIEYRDGRRIMVDAHYERVEVQEGGHWETVYRSCR
ncbi:MAG: hypothetical protein PHT59_00625 [Candidatus Omnitrophica bacterium]|nr:hypothetical protein [Candidatus Omnitrophota bacterium]